MLINSFFFLIIKNKECQKQNTIQVKNAKNYSNYF